MEVTVLLLLPLIFLVATTTAIEKIMAFPPPDGTDVGDLYPNATTPDCTTDDDTGPPMIMGRNGVIDKQYLWREFKMQLDPAFTWLEVKAIIEAVRPFLTFIPCVKFMVIESDSTPTGDYVYFKRSPNQGCNSQVGRRGGKQVINLQSPGCFKLGNIRHEVLHALGFHHEQKRPDRNEHVQIVYGNIKQGQQHNFNVLGAWEVDTFSVAYNTRSIMHYPSDAFSANGKPTILTKSGGTIPSNYEFQDSDIKKLKLLYNCG